MQGSTESRSTEAAASRIMEEFAARTGLAPRGRQIRYLWTDAFALTNYLTLLGRTGQEHYRELAVALIDRVHYVLGRHRDDDGRRGWISGFDDAEGEHHPTAGGLRIGKPLSERGPREPYDPRLEWDRDGQYYHYLVRWIHALARAGDVLEDAKYHEWAVELAGATHAAFVYATSSGGPKRIYWKKSIDLTYVLVPSEGAHDALDGFVTWCALRAAASKRLLASHDLDAQTGDLGEMCLGRRWATDDPLSAGGLLTDACWAVELLRVPGPHQVALRSLLPGLWADAHVSLVAVARGGLLGCDPEARLAFRELGLAIGLRAVGALMGSGGDPSGDPNLQPAHDVRAYLPLADHIIATWLTADARATDAWKAHADINAVMLATAMAPDEYLRL